MKPLQKKKDSIKSIICITFIALSIREHVISTGTMVPLRICVSISSPNSLSGFALSSRNKSPADKCTYPNSFEKEREEYIIEKSK